MKRQITKTISAELKPYGNTDVSCLKSFIDKDIVRRDYRREVIKLLDERHKAFMSRTKDACLDFTTLESLMREYSKDKKNRESKKKVEAEQKTLCKQLVSFLKSQDEEEFDKLTACTPSKIIKAMIEENPADERLKTFGAFSSYLKDYSANRNNIYADNNTACSAGYRLVTENFSIFIKNKDAYRKLIAGYPAVMESVISAIPELSSVITSFASTDNYMQFSVQDNIMKYNTVAGEINKAINLYSQQHPDVKKALKKLRMEKLYKQILFDSESLFPVSFKITNENELRTLIDTLWIDTLESGKVLDQIMELLNGISKYELSEIYINRNIARKMLYKMYDDESYIDGIIGSIKANKKNLLPLSDVIGHFDLEKYLKPLNGYKSEVLISYAALKTFNKITESSEAVEYLWIFMNTLNDFRRVAEFVTVDKSNVMDVEFYDTYSELYKRIHMIVKAFNSVRDFINRRPKDLAKTCHLTFDYPSFMNGWDYDKIVGNKYGAAMFKKDERVYVGIIDKNKMEKNFLDDERIRPAKPGEEVFQFVVYKQFGNPSQQLPHMFGKNAPEDVKMILDNKKKSESLYSDDELAKVIDYYKKCLVERYGNVYNLKFSETSSYKNMQEFYTEVSDCTYKIDFRDVPAGQIEEWIDDKKIYMFSVHTKDYQPGAHGSKELFTMYLEGLFSPENLKNNVIRLCGNSTVLYRPVVVKNSYVHKTGSVLLNKRDKDGMPIPGDVYKNLFSYLNGDMEKSKLSEEDLSYIERIVYKTAVRDIVKDKRYTEDKFIINLPLTINKGCNPDLCEFNDEVRKNYEYVIGIDRGERNLLYYTVTDRNGNVVEQRSLNVIDGYDYQMKLSQLEKERKDEQRKWNAVSQIKHLKEGYVGKAVYEMCRLVLKYNAIIVMESLNKVFCAKRSAAIGPAVYQQFQTALLKKLSYLVLKDRKPLEKGGILNGYQLAYCPDKIENNPVQYGIVFFVNAGYTSKIDPVTGFTNLFKFDEYDTIEKSKKFTDGFDKIYIDENGVAGLEFKYSNFKTYSSESDNKKKETKYSTRKWKCVISGSRIISRKNPKTKFWEYHNEDMRGELDSIFRKYGIELKPGTDIKSAIEEIRKTNPGIDKEFSCLMKKVMQLRNSNRNTGEDYIISPATDRYGKLFDSRNERNFELGRPVDGDSNGSRNIAIKCLMSFGMMKENERFHSVSNDDWFCGLEAFSK